MIPQFVYYHKSGILVQFTAESVGNVSELIKKGFQQFAEILSGGCSPSPT